MGEGHDSPIPTPYTPFPTPLAPYNRGDSESRRRLIRLVTTCPGGISPE
jgi:hypothetical protein